VRVNSRPPHHDPSPATNAASPSQAKSIKRRLLERVADADQTHLTIPADAGDWQPFAPGVELKLLHRSEQAQSYLLRLAPGASLPPHRHPADEECVVLTGCLQVGSHTEVGPGGYHRAQQGALHPTVGSRDGATIFLRGGVPESGHVLR
jgi:quercetin dioxygenase-like cupin family protein